jgi:hypothetical protein
MLTRGAACPDIAVNVGRWRCVQIVSGRIFHPHAATSATSIAVNFCTGSNAAGVAQPCSQNMSAQRSHGTA